MVIVQGQWNRVGMYPRTNVTYHTQDRRQYGPLPWRWARAMREQLGDDRVDMHSFSPEPTKDKPELVNDAWLTLEDEIIRDDVEGGALAVGDGVSDLTESTHQIST